MGIGLKFVSVVLGTVFFSFIHTEMSMAYGRYVSFLQQIKVSEMNYFSRRDN